MIDLDRSGGFIAVGAMACAFLAYAAMWPIVDLWGMVVLAIAWIVFFGQVVQLFAPRPKAAFWVSVGAFAFWIVFVVGGAHTWGWSDQGDSKGLFGAGEGPGSHIGGEVLGRLQHHPV